MQTHLGSAGPQSRYIALHQDVSSNSLLTSNTLLSPDIAMAGEATITCHYEHNYPELRQVQCVGGPLRRLPHAVSSSTPPVPNGEPDGSWPAAAERNAVKRSHERMKPRCHPFLDEI
jgi:hypothetical protein